jgi:uncharacterized protein
MTSAPVTRLLPTGGGADPITEDLDGWTVVAGQPTMKTYVQHTSADGSMVSGYWEATPGTYRAVYTGFEFVHLLKGRVVITPDGGEGGGDDGGMRVRRGAGLYRHMGD